MRRLKYIIMKHGNESHVPEEKKKKLEFWEDPNYIKYEEKHGEHFTEKLADWASKQMDNAKGSKTHNWTTQEVKAAYEQMGFVKPERSTWGDVAYAANMAYADYYGGSLKTDADVIRHAHEDVADPDGYPGKVFNRWLSDVMGKNIEVAWEEFMH